jgi:hypothetical protein
MKTAKILVGDVGYNKPAASGALDAIKGKWSLSKENGVSGAEGTIGGGGEHIPWTPRSPDLTPCYLYIC